MFVLHINNKYVSPLTFGQQEIASGSSYTTDPISSHHVLNGLGLMPFNILDLGDEKLPGYPEPGETWGILFRYETVEMYARYEGNGEFTINVGPLGDIVMSAQNGSMLEIKLPGLSMENNTK